MIAKLFRVVIRPRTGRKKGVRTIADPDTLQIEVQSSRVFVYVVRDVYVSALSSIIFTGYKAGVLTRHIRSRVLLYTQPS